MRNLLFLISMMLLLFACTAKTPEFTEADKAALANTIEANIGKLMQAADALDTSALEEFLSDDSQKNFLVQGTAYNKAELIATTKAEYMEIVGQKLTVQNHITRVINPSTVLWMGEILASSTDQEGWQESMIFADTWLWEKVGKSWQVSHFHESWY